MNNKKSRLIRAPNNFCNLLDYIVQERGYGNRQEFLRNDAVRILGNSHKLTSLFESLGNKKTKRKK